MGYRVAARYYSGRDQTGESYVLISDNSDTDSRLEVGEIVYIHPKDKIQTHVSNDLVGAASQSAAQARELGKRRATDRILSPSQRPTVTDLAKACRICGVDCRCLVD